MTSIAGRSSPPSPELPAIRQDRSARKDLPPTNRDNLQVRSLLLDLLDPDIAKADILSVLLEFERLVGRAVFHSSVSVLHGNVVVHLKSFLNV